MLDQSNISFQSNAMYSNDREHMALRQLIGMKIETPFSIVVHISRVKLSVKDVYEKLCELFTPVSHTITTMSFTSPDKDVGIFMESNDYFNVNEWELVEPQRIHITVIGEQKFAVKVAEAIWSMFYPFVAPHNHYTRWAYIDPKKGDIAYTTLPIKKLEHFYPEMYPFIDDVDTFIDDYKKSKQNILIMTGEPGTGKSSFINYMIARTNWRTTIAYDSEVMKRDDLYLEYLKDTDADILILEDADILLQGRLDSGNKTMSKILNVSDGIIQGKKFIFTANIQNMSDIDEAVIRPGRCYGIVNFRMLKAQEAQRAAEAIGHELKEDKKEYTAAEIFNPNTKNSQKLQKMGFGI